MNSSESRINVTKSSMPSFEEYMEELKPVWDSRWLSNRGAASVKFEDMLKSYLNVENLCLFANGHVAMEVLLNALYLKGEVITTAYTHCSTTHAIVRNGLTPVFVDINESDYQINPELIEEKITDKTVAIVATHVYGFLCDNEALTRIAKKHNLLLIYDAAHAFGVYKDGVSSASMGDAAMFSTHATKAFHTIEGGIVCYKDMEMFKAMPKLVNFGFTSQEEVDYIGTNARMNEFEAVMGICNLRHLDEEIAKRKAVGDRYYERLSGVKGIKLNEIPSDLKWNYAYFPVVFDGFKNRDQVKAELEQHNIFARKYFYPITTQLACYKGAYGTVDLPVASYVADHVLTLPMYADMTVEDADRICDVILG